MKNLITGIIFVLGSVCGFVIGDGLFNSIAGSSVCAQGNFAPSGNNNVNAATAQSSSQDYVPQSIGHPTSQTKNWSIDESILYGFLTLLGILVIAAFSYFGVTRLRKYLHDKKINERMKVAKATLQRAPISTFLKIQTAIAERDSKTLKELLDPGFYDVVYSTLPSQTTEFRYDGLRFSFYCGMEWDITGIRYIWDTISPESKDAIQSHDEVWYFKYSEEKDQYLLVNTRLARLMSLG
jgi:predicted lipid-binding transport protein (Tim44 family)